MATVIHPSAVVAPSARLGTDVEIGPFCHVGSDVTLGDGCVLLSHVTVLGPSVLGRGNRLYPQATLGAAPQDRSHAGEPTTLLVGDDNEVRESVTVHRGTVKGGGVTRIGSGGLFMVGAHVAHDCQLGDRVTLCNYTSLGGHVQVADGACAAGHVAVAPFVRLGRLCFVAGGSMVERDVPPFVIAGGDRARVRALNVVGLRRGGVSEDAIGELRAAFRALWGRAEPLASSCRSLAAAPSLHPLVVELLEDLKARRAEPAALRSRRRARGDPA